MPERDELPQADKEAGIFTWDIRAGVLYGDSAIADLFGLDKSRVVAGLPLEDYVGRVHADDKSVLVNAIRDAIVTRQSYRTEYRTLSTDGRWVHVMAFGRCFFSDEDEPISFSGIVHPVSVTDGDDLTWNLQFALTIAEDQGLAAVAAGIRGLLSGIDKSGQAALGDRQPLN